MRYGAPARLATITNFGDMIPILSYIIDDNPLKASRYSPGNISIKSFKTRQKKILI